MLIIVNYIGLLNKRFLFSKINFILFVKSFQNGDFLFGECFIMKLELLKK